jgi:hypothetical protein
MSSITLADLRADFEAAIDSATRSLIPLFNGDVERQATMTLDACIRLDPWPPEWTDYMLTGATYAVARDYGLNEAMRYKLSGGAYDPRKEGAA